jgi:FlaA1/EpsC-like NDP-sugar epimerase
MRYLYTSRRRLTLLLIDLALFACCYYFAFVIRFDSLWPAQYMRRLLNVLPLALLSSLAGMMAAGVYRSMLRYTSIKELIAIIRGALYGAALLVAAVVFVYGMKGYPRSIFILYPLFTVVVIGGSRMAYRLYVESERGGGVKKAGRSVLIVGAGDAADDLIRELRQNPRTAYRIAGVVDDAPQKRAQRIHGVEVVGEIG